MESELQEAMEFCGTVFTPVSAEVRAEVLKRLGEKNDLLRLDAPPVLPKDIVKALGHYDEDAVHVIKEVNAWKVVHGDIVDVSNHFTQESFVGFVPSLQRGELGLKPCTA